MKDKTLIDRSYSLDDIGLTETARRATDEESKVARMQLLNPFAPGPSFLSWRKHAPAITRTMVDRKDVRQEQTKIQQSIESQTLMVSCRLYSIISSQRQFVPSKILGSGTLPSLEQIALLESCPVRSVQADWDQKRKARTGGDANVFGSTGVLELLEESKVLTIPSVPAQSVSKTVLAGFGAELVSITDRVDLDQGAYEQLYFKEYRFDADYIRDYVFQVKGGGGLFVEKHDFPHLFVPMEPTCSGALILGKATGQSSYDFTAFEIPYGFGLKIQPNVIHGDSFFVGRYAITLDEALPADTVIFHEKGGTRYQDIALERTELSTKVECSKGFRL